MRSQFLTLLCVFTFLSCGWGLADSVVSFAETDAVSATSRIKRRSTPEQAKKRPEPYVEDRTLPGLASSGDSPMPGDPEQIRKLAIAQFGYSLLTLAGAILMFRQRRIGFWIYVAGIFIGLAGPVLLAGFGALNTSFGVFFSILFAILYGYCLNEMR